MGFNFWSTLVVVTELFMEAVGLFLAYRFGAAYVKTRDTKLLLVTIAFVIFLIADIAIFVGTTFFGMDFRFINEWHQIVLNALLIILALIVVRGPGWQEKVKLSRAYTFGAKGRAGTERKGAA